MGEFSSTVYSFQYFKMFFFHFISAGFILAVYAHYRYFYGSRQLPMNYVFAAEQIEDDDVVRWAGTLPRARKTRLQL
jgi:hypothetical protein